MRIASRSARIVCRTALAVSLLSHALAQAPSFVRQRPPAQPGDVDLGKSLAFVRVGATGLGHEHGAEGSLSAGHIALGAREHAGELVFDMASFTAETGRLRKYVGLDGESDRSTAQKVTTNMRSADVLNVEQFPKAVFNIASALPAGPARAGQPPQYILEGKLTMHGVTQPLRVAATVETSDGMLHVRGQFAVLQSKFGITPYTKAFGAIGVADELKIWGDLWLYATAPQR